MGSSFSKRVERPVAFRFCLSEGGGRNEKRELLLAADIINQECAAVWPSE